MSVADAVRRIGRLDILRPDVEAAGEGDPAVYHQQLAVVAQVEERRLPREVGMQEARDRDARLAQAVVGARPEVTAADAVDQHPHLHAALLRRDQRLMELLARLVGPEDVAAQADAFLRPADLLEHPRIGLVAAAQHLHGVSGLRGQAGQPADRIFQRRERVRRSPGTVGRGEHQRLALASQPLGAPLHAVDAHDGVEQSAHEGRQPGNPDPGHSGADAALVEQHMNRHRAGNGDVGHCGNGAHQRRHIVIENHFARSPTLAMQPVEEPF